MNEAFVGFDSAWADKQPGALVHASFRANKLLSCSTPKPVHFDEAQEIICKLKLKHDHVLVALDQPTLVPNPKGMRPVERVAASLISKLRGGVQPANQNRPQFVSDAPIWRFLEQLGARQDPPASRAGKPGLYLVEVFPALALPALEPQTFERRYAAKYNPKNRRTFCISDWCLVCNAVARHARELGLQSLAEWSICASGKRPDKSLQDKLDAIICLIIAIQWRRSDSDKVALIGDGCSGYMVTPVSTDTKRILKQAADKIGVPFNAHSNF